MYYINSFFIYSILGFLLESAVYKISDIDKYSGFLYGPFTIIYGIGVVAILLLNRYFFSKLKVNKYLKILIIFITLAIILTLFEYLGGHLLKILFDIEMWNYSHKLFHIGKYICLELSIIWGLFGVLFIYFLKPFMDNIIKKIPKKLTYFFSIIFIIDIIVVVFTK